MAVALVIPVVATIATYTIIAQTLTVTDVNGSVFAIHSPIASNEILYF